MHSTRYGIQANKEALHNLSLKVYDDNVTKMLIARRNIIDELAAQGQGFSEDLFWLYKTFETSSNKAFLRWLEQEKSNWEQEKANCLTAEELQEEAEVRYKHLVESNKWSQEKSESKQIIALHAVVSELVKTVALQAKATTGKPKNEKGNESDRKEKNQWKYVAPADGDAKTKVVGDKTYYFCGGHDGKAHRAMWSMHQPDACSIEKSREKRNAVKSETDSAKAADKKGEAKAKNAPSLQPNKSMQSALAALNKFFPATGTSNDDGSADGSDF